MYYDKSQKLAKDIEEYLKNNSYNDLANLIIQNIPECYYNRLLHYKNHKSHIMNISKPNRQEVKEELQKQLNSIK